MQELRPRKQMSIATEKYEVVEINAQAEF